MRIGLLNNVRAGKNDKRMASFVRSLDRFPEVRYIETSSSGGVPEALWRFAHEGVDLLAVNGGDGTLQTVLTEILGNRAFAGRVPLVAPLRGGRTNMTALDLGTQRDSVRALGELVEAARADAIDERIVERHVLRVEHGVQGKVHYGMFFGAGTIYRAIQRVHRIFPDGRAQGVIGGTLMTGALLTRLASGRDPGQVLAPDRAHVYLDGAPVAAESFTLMMATSLERLFAGMRPFWGDEPGGVRFTCIAEGARRPWQAVPSMLTGRPNTTATEENGYTSRNADQLRLMLDCGITVDGELMAPLPGAGGATVTADDCVQFVRA